MKKNKSKKDILNDLYLGIGEEAECLANYLIEELSKDLNLKFNLDFAVVSMHAKHCVLATKINKEMENKSFYYKTSNGNLALHPLAMVLPSIEKSILTTGDKLGLSPLARKKILDKAGCNSKANNKSKIAQLREKTLNKANR